MAGMFCKYCGQQLEVGAGFCPRCGKAQTATHTEGPRINQHQSSENIPLSGQYYPPQHMGYVPQYTGAPNKQQLKPKKKRGCLISSIIAGVVMVAIIIGLFAFPNSGAQKDMYTEFNKTLAIFYNAQVMTAKAANSDLYSIEYDTWYKGMEKAADYWDELEKQTGVLLTYAERLEKEIIEKSKEDADEVFYRNDDENGGKKATMLSSSTLSASNISWFSELKSKYWAFWDQDSAKTGTQKQTSKGLYIQPSWGDLYDIAKMTDTRLADSGVTGIKALAAMLDTDAKLVAATIRDEQAKVAADQNWRASAARAGEITNAIVSTGCTVAGVLLSAGVMGVGATGGIAFGSAVSTGTATGVAAGTGAYASITNAIAQGGVVASGVDACVSIGETWASITYGNGSEPMYYAKLARSYTKPVSIMFGVAGLFEQINRTTDLLQQKDYGSKAVTLTTMGMDAVTSGEVVFVNVPDKPGAGDDPTIRTATLTGVLDDGAVWELADAFRGWCEENGTFPADTEPFIEQLSEEDIEDVDSDTADSETPVVTPQASEPIFSPEPTAEPSPESKGALISSGIVGYWEMYQYKTSDGQVTDMTAFGAHFSDDGYIYLTYDDDSSEYQYASYTFDGTGGLITIINSGTAWDGLVAGEFWLESETELVWEEYGSDGNPCLYMRKVG